MLVNLLGKKGVNILYSTQWDKQEILGTKLMEYVGYTSYNISDLD